MIAPRRRVDRHCALALSWAARRSPRTLEDLCGIVREARALGATVRVFGSRPGAVAYARPMRVLLAAPPTVGHTNAPRTPGRAATTPACSRRRPRSCPGARLLAIAVACVGCAGASPASAPPARAIGPDASPAAAPAGGAIYPDAPPPLVDGVLAAGESHACAIDARGATLCWGDGELGELGDGATTSRAAPVRVRSLDDAVSLCAGSYYSCAARRGGGVACWGQNHFGQLGAAMPRETATPLTVPGVADAVAIACGHGHACAIDRAGVVRCWGDGERGQLGRPAARRGVAAVVEGLGPVAWVAAGRAHTCAVDREGAAFCWGENAEGQLGDGTRASRSTPARVQGLPAVGSVATGDFATCAVARSGEVWCWGANGGGLLVGGAPGTLLVATRVPGATAATRVTLGQNHVCAIDAEGEARCWGNREVTGVPSSDPASYVHGPARIEGLPWVRAIAAGAGFTCAATGRSPVCWGQMLGGLGDGRPEGRSRTPVVVRWE